MSDEQTVNGALAQAHTDTTAEMANSPTADTGCCTISAGGWSEQKSGITKSACDKQKGPGVTVSWAKGSC